MHWNIHYIIPRFGSRWFLYRLLATELIGDHISTDHSKLSALVSSPSSYPVPDAGKSQGSFSRDRSGWFSGRLTFRGQAGYCRAGMMVDLISLRAFGRAEGKGEKRVG